MQQDEKVENVIDIFNQKNISLRKEINEKIADVSYRVRMEGLKLLFENYFDLPSEEALKNLTKGAEDDSKYLKIWMINNFNSSLGKNIPIEVRRDISRKLMKNNDETIKQKVKEFLTLPVDIKISKSESNKDRENIKQMLFNKQSNFLTYNDELFSKKYGEIFKNATISDPDNNFCEMKEYILCLTLWMGGDGAIINYVDISQYLPNNIKDIKKSLEELRKEKILINLEGNYSLTKRGSILTDSILLKIIARWYNASEWVNIQGYSTMHHGFIKDKRNTALSNLQLSSRSFITDYFQCVLENLVEYYSYKKISYFSSFRKILILICLNPTLNFMRLKSKEFGEIFTDFSDTDIIKIVDHNDEKLILFNEKLLIRRQSKDWK
jgi:hypothetical protein